MGGSLVEVQLDVYRGTIIAHGELPTTHIISFLSYANIIIYFL